MALGKVPGTDHDDAAGDDAVFADINITPLTDIFLVLLIIFMVVSPALSQRDSDGARAGLKVNLPQGGHADVAAQATDLSVAILQDGTLMVSGARVSADELKKAFDDAKLKSPDTLVVVQADEGVPHGKVVEVMELAKGAGLGQLAIGVRDGPGK